MAYTKSPTMDTYSSERVKLYREMNTRDGGEAGKDEDYVNVFVETIRKQNLSDDRKFIVKRNGTTSVITSVAATPVRGSFFWTDQSKILYCVGRNVYVYNVNTGVSTTLSNVFATSSGYVGFCEFLYDNGTVKICATDGTATSGLVTIDSSNTVVTCADADLPTHLPYPVFLDGYLFLAKASSADVYNSDLNNPLSWTAGTLLQAEFEGDLVTRIAKLNNYLVVFGTETVEYWWDAANAAPSSPMQRNDTPIKLAYYLGGFAIYGNSIFFIGKSAAGQPDVYELKDFKIENIGTPAVSRYLNACSDTFALWKGNIVSIQGHTFYMITAGTGKTYVYDLEEKLWYRWAFQANSTFDINIATIGTTTSKVITYFSLTGNNSTIYKFDPTLYKDNGTNYTCVITTEGNDFGTMNRKTMKRASIIGDRPANDANLTVQWSDDDYRTFNTGLTTNLNQDLPCIYRLGSFRQRIFKLTFSADELFRIQELEVDINKGAS